MKQAQRYIDNVLSGKELVCELTRLAVERHLNDLNRQEVKEFQFEFSEKQATRALKFFRILKHTKGKLGGKPFNLQDNQAFILAMLFGWRRKGSGLRRFTQAYIEESRKGGKSELAAGIEIYTGFFENEEGAEVYTAATTRDQANMVFRAAKKMCKYLKQDSKAIRGQIEVMANSVVFHPTDSFIQKVSADAGTLDGLNPHCAVIDEYHAHKDDGVKGVMQTGMGSRESPLLLIITTAGFQKEYPCFQVERANAVAVLKAEKRQENLFSVIFTQDEGEIEKIMSLDTEVPEQAAEILRLAKKSNPNLGSTPTESYLLEQVKDAQNKGSSTRVQVLTKNFNCWLDAPEVWIPEEKIKAVMRPIEWSEFAGRTLFLGLDLAAVSDFTALCAYAPPEDGKKGLVKLLYWVPSGVIPRKSDIAPYRQWMEDGHLLATEGENTDYSVIRQQVFDFNEQFKIQSIGWDKWDGYETAIYFAGLSIDIQECRPYYQYLSKPCKNIEVAISSQEIELDDNPVTLWMFRNIVLDRDSWDNIKPNKKDRHKKIDGVSAWAYAGWAAIVYFGEPQNTSYLFDESTELITV